MNPKVTIEKQADIAIINVDNPPVNALSQAVRAGLMACIDEAAADPAVAAIILICRGRTFIAGADIKEFGKPAEAPMLPDLLNHLEACPKPVIAAMHGTALGGGLETALACRYRIAVESASVGLPEVHLGLLPGAGGTQRLPRIAGLENALDMVTSGRHVGATEAESMGLIDRIAGNGQLLESAVGFARQIVDTGATRQAASEIQMQDTAANRQTLATWQSRVEKKARGQRSPLVALESVGNALSMPFAAGLARERELFSDCLASVQSKALRYIFFAERAAAKLPDGISAAPLPVEEVAVIGGGTMGRGIAMCFANNDIPVRIIEANEERLEQSMQDLESAYSDMQSSGRIDEARKEKRLSLIDGSCDHEKLETAGLVIEAVFEDLDIKRRIFASMDLHCKKDAVLATNTSYLDIESIAAEVGDPSRVVGMHFFAPAHIMKLLEVVRTPQTSGTSLATAMQVGKRLGKRCVVVGNGFGFAANRMYSAYQAQGQQMLLQGVTPARLDGAMKEWGMAMGPASVMDLSGLDVGYRARRQNPDLPDDPAFFRPADLLVEHGFIGRKSGRGFYRYDGDAGRASEDEEVIELIRNEAARLGIEQRDLSDAEIQENMISAIALEGRRILAEGIAAKPADLDVIWVNGYGFPRWRGGPMYMAGEPDNI